MVAVDVGGYGLRAVQFTKSKTGATITKSGFALLPPGAVEGGEVVDVDAVAVALKSMWSKSKFSSKQVVFGLSNKRLVVRQMDLDWDEDEDFRRALKYQVADHIPIATMNEVNLDYHTLAEYEMTDADGNPRRMKRVLVVAAVKEMVEKFVTAIEKAGLQPVKADLNSFALIRASQPHPAVTDTAEATIDMGTDVTNVVVHQGGQPQFVRTLTGSAGRFLTETLSQQFSWTVEEAERSKVELGLATTPGTTPHPAQEVIDHVISAATAEVRNSVDFFLSNAPHVTSLSRVVLSGGAGNLKGLAERLSSELKVPVEYSTPAHATASKGLTVPDGITEQQLSVAVGLAMGAS